MQTENNFEQKETTVNSMTLRRFFFKILRRWPWIVLSLLFAVSVAYLSTGIQRRYTTYPSTILSKKYERQTSRNALDVIQGGEYFSTVKDINREITVLRSYSIVSEAISRLRWEISYYKEGNIKTAELYKSSPIKVAMDTSADRDHVPYEVMFRCHFINPGKFTLSSDDEEWDQKVSGKQYTYGTSFKPMGEHVSKLSWNRPVPCDRKTRNPF